jgi:hypothetical protein
MIFLIVSEIADIFQPQIILVYSLELSIFANEVQKILVHHFIG